MLTKINEHNVEGYCINMEMQFYIQFVQVVL